MAFFQSVNMRAVEYSSKKIKKICIHNFLFQGRSDLFSGAMQLMPSETVDTIIGLTQQGLDAGNLENLYCQMDMQVSFTKLLL
jgi:hypothetical protein